MTGSPPIPVSLRAAATRLGARWTEDERGYASQTLLDDLINEHPGIDAPSDRRLRRHYREVFAPAMLEAAWSDIQSRIADGAIRLWRSVRIEGDVVPALSEGGIGVYWAYERDRAHPHDNTSAAAAYLLEATVPVEGIDWIETLAAATHPDWSGESEVRLLPDAEVVLLSVYRREGWLRRNSDDELGDPVDIGELAGTTFRAGRDAPALVP